MHIFETHLQATDERVAYAIDMSARKPVGGSVSSATGTYTPSTGTPVALTTAVSVSGDTVTATVIGGTDFTTLATVSAPAYLDVLMVLSNSEKVRARVPIVVPV